MKSELRLSSNLIAMSDETGSIMNLHEPSITANEIRKFPKPPPSSLIKESKSHLKAHSKKDALGSSTAISTAVAGATSLLQSVISISDRTAPGSNANLMKTEAKSKKAALSTSSSDHAFKTSRVDKRYDKKPESEELKLKLLDKKNSQQY